MSNNHLNRYLVHLSYLGTNYSGWQIQNNAESVQGIIMKGFHLILDENTPLMVGSGRTDSGVHAVNFFAHFDTFSIDTLNMTHKLNSFLPDDIVIHSIQHISSDFHARFSAFSRQYEYWLSTVKDPFLINRAYFFSKSLNVDIMNKGASMLVGEHNFSAFSKSNSDNSICFVKSACWIKSKNMLLFSIESDRFLYNMVRCIVGTLINLGLEKISLQDFSHIMRDGNRSKSGCSVPACGLYLMNVKYPKSFKL